MTHAIVGVAATRVGGDGVTRMLIFVVRQYNLWSGNKEDESR